MFNPLVDPSILSDVELQEKIRDLSNKYYQTANDAIRNQLLVILDMYKNEEFHRNSTRNSNDDIDFDKFIKIK